MDILSVEKTVFDGLKAQVHRELTLGESVSFYDGENIHVFSG